MTKHILFNIVTLFLLNAGDAQPIVFTIDIKHKEQTIENFGASGAWFSERIGRNWPQPKKRTDGRIVI